jgi:hypothetical protein
MVGCKERNEDKRIREGGPVLPDITGDSNGSTRVMRYYIVDDV